MSALETIWEWLRQQPEYLIDYKELKRAVEQKNALPFEIKNKGGFSRNRFEVIIHGHVNFRNCRDIDETEKRKTRLKEKYALLATTSQYARQEKFRKKWGFYPMFSPYDEIASDSFFEFIKTRFANGRFDKAVRSLNFNEMITGFQKSRGVSFGFPPAYLNLEVDWRQGDRIIFHQLKKILRSIRKIYEIRPDRSRYDFATLVVKNDLLKRAGLKQSEIKKRLMKKELRFEARDSYRKTLEKAFSKVRPTES